MFLLKEQVKNGIKAKELVQGGIKALSLYN